MSGLRQREHCQPDRDDQEAGGVRAVLACMNTLLLPAPSEFPHDLGILLG